MQLWMGLKQQRLRDLQLSDNVALLEGLAAQMMGTNVNVEQLLLAIQPHMQAQPIVQVAPPPYA